MSNEQKLREIIRKLLDRVRDMEDCGPPGETWQSDELMAEIAEAEQALATTEPEPLNEREASANYTKDAERYRWLASSESDAMNAKSKVHQWSVTDAWTTLQKPGADKALIDAAIDAAMALGVKG